MTSNCHNFVSKVQIALLLSLVYLSTIETSRIVGRSDSGSTSSVSSSSSSNSNTCSSNNFFSRLNITVTHNKTVPNIEGHLSIVNCGPNTADPSNHSVSSSCPWEVMTHTDHGRVPYTMSYVRCRCKRCVHSHSSDNQNSRGNGYCQAVTREFSVMRQYCVNGNVTYKREFEEFPVACVCVPRQVAQALK